MKNLKKQLIAFEIGSPNDNFPFTQRLARENAWPIDFAHQVVTEYKRFIYLVAVSKHEITPSDQVDQAWHLHMTYTQSYWVDLCRNTLGFELHHYPTKGGREESIKFRRQYSETLDLYKHTFKESPPETIWPQAQARFKSSDNFVRINKARHWVFSKPDISLKQFSFFIALTVSKLWYKNDEPTTRAFAWVLPPSSAPLISSLNCSEIYSNKSDSI